MNIQILGRAEPLSFSITSGKMMVSDPCYDRSLGGQKELRHVKCGKWLATVIYSNEGRCDARVAALLAWHESSTCPDNDYLQVPIDVELCVDSGQMSFFDADHYPDAPFTNSSFYEMVCGWTLGSPSWGALEDFGVVKWVSSVAQGIFPGAEGTDCARLRASTDYDDKAAYNDLRTSCGETLQWDAVKYCEFVAQFGYGNFGGNENGVASSTGLGDGGYRGWIKRDNGPEIVAVKVVFLGDDEEDIEDWDDDEED